MYIYINHEKFEVILTTLLQEFCIKNIQVSTIGERHIRTYYNFYWRTHDFGYAYIDMYDHFFPIFF